MHRVPGHIDNMKLYDLTAIGQACKRIRKRKGIKQGKIACDTMYSESNIVKFERGENNNMLLLLYYMDILKIDWEDIKYEMERFSEPD